MSWVLLMKYRFARKDNTVDWFFMGEVEPVKSL